MGFPFSLRKAVINMIQGSYKDNKEQEFMEI